MMTKGPDARLMMAGDMVRFVMDVLMHSAALMAGGAAFIALWRHGGLPCLVLAFPVGYLAGIVGFYVAIVIARVLFVRQVMPGVYALQSREARRWIAAQWLILIVQRSFLRTYVEEFALPRYLFYRLMGAKVHPSLFAGAGLKVLDPWALEVGRDVVVGAYSVITSHMIDGNNLTIRTVRIGDGAMVGGNAIIHPGVEIGARAVVGAGALVTKGTTIPPGAVWAGVPARPMRKPSGQVERSRVSAPVSVPCVELEQPLIVL